MVVSSLTVNQLSEEGFGWYRRYLEAVAAKDVDAVDANVAEDVVFQVNNALPVYGKQALRETVLRYFAGLTSLHHELLMLIGSDRLFAVEMLVHYVLRDGRKLTIPGAVFIERNREGLLQGCRLYIDNAEVFRPFQSGRT